MALSRGLAQYQSRQESLPGLGQVELARVVVDHPGDHEPCRPVVYRAGGFPQQVELLARQDAQLLKRPRSVCEGFHQFTDEAGVMVQKLDEKPRVVSSMPCKSCRGRQ
uniref:Transposase n=1 Tax=Kitasatospora sp. CMC57 TaxID=3231513 RepID=A0AB33K5A4_9ACTN